MFTLAIHGGAGLSHKSDLSPEREALAISDLRQSLSVGASVLAKGGSSLDATIAAVSILEDSPLFNAGKGSVFACDGVQRMDASVMDGKSGLAGALCGVSTIKNPIKAARLIMEHTPHVMLYGKDAEALAAAHHPDMVNPEWFHTQYRWDQLQRAIAANALILDHEQVPSITTDNSKGTVGAVACDVHGHLAAATSTGGLVNKRSGRVGDSAIIGAGTYAKNTTCAVSATGHGELFIRANVAGRLSALIELSGLSLEEAANRIVHKELPQDAGGLIAVDRLGTIVLPFNSGGMFRGYVRKGEPPVVEIW